MANPNRFLAFLKARAAEIITPASLRRKLASGRTLRVKLGIDPTTPDLHLGHVVPLKILRAFQDAGHRAVLIIGDFTGQIGDPAGAATARRQLTAAAVKRNERTYLAQAGTVLDLRRTEVRHNREWYDRMRVKAFLDLLTRFSLQSAWQREDFQKRLASGREVHLHEAMYHVLQAYDSVAVAADVEIGSLDQKLNMIAGRELQATMGVSAQDIVLLPYLIGLDGTRKMSKSMGNTINLSDGPRDMLGKVMAIPDRRIEDYARLGAWCDDRALRRTRSRLASGENPRDVKLDVAEALVGLYHGAPAAARARRDFVILFSKRGAPPSLPTLRIARRPYRPVDLARIVDPSLSRSAARRLVAGGGLAVDGRALRPGGPPQQLPSGSTIRLGKKRYVRVA